VILQVDKVDAYYGIGHILHGLSLNVGESEVVALLGRNGAGKTTTMRCIAGLTPPRRGEIRYKGSDIAGVPPHRVSRMGIALVPETRDIFSYLTVRENLVIAQRAGSRWRMETVLERFPKLAGTSYYDRVAELGPRHIQILELILSGCNNQEISNATQLSLGTVKNYVSAILLALDVRSRAHLISLFH